MFPDSAGNKGRFAQPAVRFPIFGINDNMLVVVWGLGVLRRDSHETPEGLPPYQWEWAGRVAVGEGSEADPNLGWSDQPRLRQPAKGKAEAQSGH